MGDRFDRTTFQIQPTEDLKVYQQRVNEQLARISLALSELSGTSGPSTTQDAANIHTDGYNFMQLDNLFGVNAALCSNNDPTNKKFYSAYGAKRDTDGGWVATNKTAVLLEYNDSGSLNLYSNTGLTAGAAFIPTLVGALTPPAAPSTPTAKGARWAASSVSGGLMVWGTENFNDDSSLFVRQSSNTEIKVTAAGLYIITFQGYDNGTTVDTGYAWVLYKNGSEIARTGTHSGNTGGNTYGSGAIVDRTSANDVYKVVSGTWTSTLKFSIARIGL